MSLREAIVLQSGFLAFKNEGFVINPDDGEKQRLLMESKFDKHYIRDKSIYAYHKKVDDVFTTYQKDATVIKNFDFREEVFVAVLEAFNTVSFFDWVELQKKGTFFTGMNKEFLNDVFNYLNGGQWKVSPESWYRIIEAKLATADDSRVELKDEEFFGLANRVPYKNNFAVKDILTNWLRQGDGVKNLLYVASIIFGQKHIPHFR